MAPSGGLNSRFPRPALTNNPRDFRRLYADVSRAEGPAPASSRHVPVDGGRSSNVSVRHHIVDDGKDPVIAGSSNILMHRDVAGAVAVEVADPGYLEGVG